MTENIKKDILWRVYLVYLGILFLGLAIIGKAAYIQFYEGPELVAKSERQEIREFDLKANRGNIYDVNGNLLATSVPIFEIRMPGFTRMIRRLPPRKPWIWCGCRSPEWPCLSPSGN